MVQGTIEGYGSGNYREASGESGVHGKARVVGHVLQSSQQRRPGQVPREVWFGARLGGADCDVFRVSSP